MRAIIYLFFPPSCAVCKRLLVRGERVLCLSCLSQLPLSYFWDWSNNPAFSSLEDSIKVEEVISLMIYRKESPWKESIYRFKYYGKREIGQFLARLLAQKLIVANVQDRVDIVIPIPLHPIKRWIRGFNQAEIIAKELALALEAECCSGVVRRKRYTFTQTKRGREERKEAVADAFVIAKKRRRALAGKGVLLVDDLLTTGATVEACGRVLLEGGCSSLSIATLAYVE